MASFLGLPRELYLMICSFLTTADLCHLASVSRNHYIAVQEPLFSHVRITSWDALARLVETFTKVPVVSHISSNRRLYWYRIGDEKLRDRDIKHLDLVLDNGEDGAKITGAVLLLSIDTLSQKCSNLEISLTLNGISERLLFELQSLTLPNVTQLTTFARPVYYFDPNATEVDIQAPEKIWALAFSGTIFPDLRQVYMSNLVDNEVMLPPNMEQQFLMANAFRPSMQRLALLEHNNTSSSISEHSSFHSLLHMREIKLELNSILETRLLESLFTSNFVPQSLARLEIVNCPRLHPIRDIEALATLLQRTLQSLKFLKLHLTPHFDGFDGYEIAYKSKIAQHPEHHLCEIVRDLGQNIEGLDLALPFACNNIFLPVSKDALSPQAAPLDPPSMIGTPVNSLPQRLMDAGYRYRRLIFNGICGDDDGWEDMAMSASNQGDKTSWELLHDWGYGSKAMWFVADCAPVEFSMQAAMAHPFNED